MGQSNFRTEFFNKRWIFLVKPEPLIGTDHWHARRLTFQDIPGPWNSPLISDRNESGRSKPIMKANSFDKITFKAGKIQARLQKLVRVNITTDVTNSEKSTFNLENVVLSAKKKVGKLSDNSQPFSSPSVAWTIRARSGCRSRLFLLRPEKNISSYFLLSSA